MQTGIFRKILICCCVMFANSSFAHAETIASPATILKKGQWTFGLDAGAFVDRGLKIGSTTGKATLFHGGHFRGVGITDRLSVYGKIGGGKLDVEDDLAESNFGGVLIGSGQIKLRLWEDKEKDLEWDSGLRLLYLHAAGNANEGDWYEWQFSSTVAKSFGRFTPYGGILFSSINFKFDKRKNNVTLRKGTYDEDKFFGVVFGTDIRFEKHDNIVLNVEGSYVDGSEFTLSLIRFF